jgi:hypothetical protein
MSDRVIVRQERRTLHLALLVFLVYLVYLVFLTMVFYFVQPKNSKLKVQNSKLQFKIQIYCCIKILS